MAGDVAEMMLDGTLCEACGAYMGDSEPQGFPGYCSPQCARDRGAGVVATDAECVEYMDDIGDLGLDHRASDLRVFMGVGKKRAKRLVAQWRAAQAAKS